MDGVAGCTKGMQQTPKIIKFLRKNNNLSQIVKCLKKTQNDQK